MSIVALPAFHDNYIWAIVNEDARTFLCVDPGDATPVLRYASENGLKLTDILITHHHNDHVGGVPALLQHNPDCHVYAPQDPRIVPLAPCIDHRRKISIGAHTFHVLNIPGHTSSHICYYEPKAHWLFCGDTLFSAGCGRVFDGTIEQLYHSLQLIKHLPNYTQIYCGHEYTRDNLRFAAKIEPHNPYIQAYAAQLNVDTKQCSLPTTVAQEKKINPFLHTNTHDLDAFAHAHHVDPFDEIELFRQLRGAKDAFK